MRIAACPSCLQLWPGSTPPSLLPYYYLHCTAKLKYSTKFCQNSNATNLSGNKLVTRRSRSRRRRRYTCKTCANFNLNCVRALLAGAARADSLPQIPCIPQWTILFFFWPTRTRCLNHCKWNFYRLCHLRSICFKSSNLNLKGSISYIA